MQNQVKSLCNKKAVVLFWAIIGCACLTLGFMYAKKNSPASLKMINSEELKNGMASGKFVVINPLSRKTFDDASIAGSINIPLKTLRATAKKLFNKNQSLVVYSASVTCQVSRNAAEILSKAGFKNVFIYEGGMKDWHNKKLPAAGPCTMRYLYNEGNETNKKAGTEKRIRRRKPEAEKQKKSRNGKSADKKKAGKKKTKKQAKKSTGRNKRQTNTKKDTQAKKSVKKTQKKKRTSQKQTAGKKRKACGVSGTKKPKTTRVKKQKKENKPLESLVVRSPQIHEEESTIDE